MGHGAVESRLPGAGADAQRLLAAQCNAAQRRRRIADLVVSAVRPTQLKPKWETRNGQIRVTCCDLDLLDLFVRYLEHTDPFSTHRHPSGASASEHTQPHPVLTEDDVLVRRPTTSLVALDRRHRRQQHTRNLPEFGGALAQRDSELLLSYLTTPYIRLPLVVTFFSQEDRVHALRDTTIRRVLDSAVFEPGAHATRSTRVLTRAPPCRSAFVARV